MIASRIARPALLLAASLAAASPAASGQPPLLYPEVILAPEDDQGADAELVSFTNRLSEAAETLVMIRDVGEMFDPRAMLPLLDEQVELFIGEKAVSGDGAFRTLGSMDALDLLETVGRLGRWESAEPEVNRRLGMRVIAQLLRDGSAGATPWLGGRVCTAAYGRLAPGALERLAEAAGVPPDRWVIAGAPPRNDEDGAAGRRGFPKPFQLVPRSDRERRDGGWVAVLAPGGGTLQLRSWPWDEGRHFAPYLNSHLCFSRASGAWKVDAVALRLD